MIDSRPKKVKWIGRINCNWLKFVPSTQYGYEFSSNLKSVTASTDDNGFNISDTIKVKADSGYGVKVSGGIRTCSIYFKQIDSEKECSLNVSQNCVSEKCPPNSHSEDEITYKVDNIAISPSYKDGLPYSGGIFNLTGSANITEATKYPLYWCGTNKKTGEYSSTTETYNNVDITNNLSSVWSISNPISGDSITKGKLTYAKVDSSREIIVNLEYSGLTTSATLEQNYDTNTYDYDFTITPSSSLEWSGDESGSSFENSVTIICQKITNKGEKRVNIDFTYTFDGLDNFTIGKEKEGNINDGFIFSFYPSSSNFSENDYKGVLTLKSSIGNAISTITLTQTKAEPKNSDDALMGKFILTVAFNLTQLEKDGLYKEDDKLPVYINHQTSGDRNDVEKVWYASSKNPTENGYSISAINMSNTVAFDFNTNYCQCMFDVKDDAIITDKTNGDKKVVFFVQTSEGSTVPEEIEWLNKYPFCIRIPDGYTKIANASVYRNESLKTLIVGSGINECISDCFAGLSEITDMYFGPLKAPTLEHDASQGYTFRDTTAKVVNNPSCIFHLQPAVKEATNMNGYNENSDTSMYEDAEAEIWKWPGCFLANVKEDPRWHNYTKEIDAQMVNALTQWWNNKKFDFDPANALDIFNKAIFG